MGAQRRGLPHHLQGGPQRHFAEDRSDRLLRRGHPGASTITQQVVRNITNDRAVDGAAGWARKLREIFRALNVEKYYTKPQIIETYLNLASFSQNCSGIQAAANVFFNKDVSEPDRGGVRHHRGHHQKSLRL